MKTRRTVSDALIRAIHADYLRLGSAARALAAHGGPVSIDWFLKRARRLGLAIFETGPRRDPASRADRFRCARCGRRLTLLDAASETDGRGEAKFRFRVGGAWWCSDCYRERFRAQLRWRDRAQKNQIDYTSPFFRAI